MPRPDPLPPPKARPSPLDNPAVAAHAWARFRRLMRLMFLVTTGTVLIALALLYKQVGLVSVHFYIAVAVGISFAMLLTAGLMGLVFLSAGTGHDGAVGTPAEPGDEDKDENRDSDEDRDA
ncbi:MAG TPA: hypothetical protein VFF98_04710 [Novosphingobium sp.]|nr:hypothetical protein [Novosphingobium sp.]